MFNGPEMYESLANEWFFYSYKATLPLL